MITGEMPMRVLRDRQSIAAIVDPALRILIEQRVESLSEFDDCELHELVTFVVVEPGDSLEAIDSQLGFPILTNRFDGIRFGESGFTPSFDILEEHAGYYEIVFVLSDDGFGVEIFIPKHPDVHPQLLALCAAYATPAKEQSDP